MNPQKYVCETCQDTGYATIPNGPEDFEKVACPDCNKGLEILENEEIDMTGADEKHKYDR